MSNTNQETNNQNNPTFTKEEVESYNRYTFFPTTVEKQNNKLAEQVKQDRDYIASSLKKWGYEVIPENIESLLARVAQARKYMFIAESKARLIAPGAMIVGPANYLKRARPERAEKVREKALEMFSLAQAKLTRALNKFDANAPISSDDPDAIEKLQIRIDKSEKRQAQMVAGNKIVKSAKLSLEQKVAELAKLGVGADRLEKDFCGRVGYPPYELSNNSGNMKRMKDRVKELEAKKGDITREWTNGSITITDNVEENRLQIYFPSKPGSETIDQLKSNGFHWSYNNGVWQRMRSFAATHYASQITGIDCK